MKKVWGPILIGRSTSPITDLLEPSKALTTKVLGFIISPFVISFSREFLGKTIKDEPMLTKTMDKIVSTQLSAAMLSLNPKQLPTAMLDTSPSN